MSQSTEQLPKNPNRPQVIADRIRAAIAAGEATLPIDELLTAIDEHSCKQIAVADRDVAADRQTFRDGFRFGMSATSLAFGLLMVTLGLCLLKTDEATTSSIE